VIIVALPSMCLPPSLAATAQGSPGSPPPFLNITHVRVKPGSSGAYAAAELQVVRAFERTRTPVYWIGLQAPKDSLDVLYLNLFESREALDRATAAYQDAAKQHSELQNLQKRMNELTAGQTSMWTLRREDVDRPPQSVDFSTLRTLRVTTFQVRAGREGAFVQAVRTANPKDGSWLVYESADSPTFLLLTLKRSGLAKADGPALPRNVRHKDVYTKADTRVYTVRPAMSHVPQSFVAAHPQLWKIPPPATP
jgi:hypothetical protein